MLRDSPIVDEDGQFSDTLYIRGMPRTETDESVSLILAASSRPVSVDTSLREKSGQIWAKYENSDAASRCLLYLHNTNINGSVLSVKYELGIDGMGKRRVDRSGHNTIIRTISKRKVGNREDFKNGHNGLCMCKRNPESGVMKCACCAVTGKRKGTTSTEATTSTAIGVSYTSNSLFVNSMEYPFPSGLYLSRVIELGNSLDHPAGDPLYRIVTDTRSVGNKYAKEISEGMAMADAVQRAISMLPLALKRQVTGQQTACSDSASADRSSSSTSSSSSSAPSRTVAVYVLGDGCRPLTAACLCLQLPAHCYFYSIDPIMDAALSCSALDLTADPHSTVCPADLTANPVFGVYQERFHPVRCFSQQFTLPTTCSSPVLSIVVSCHSHAPLQEFWERLCGPKVAVAMPCCAGFAELQYNAPTLEFADFEVYSPKREVKIYIDV